jgi:hypothetical protein
MSDDDDGGPLWEFNNEFRLLNSLSLKKIHAVLEREKDKDGSVNGSVRGDDVAADESLGDFTAIWKSLGLSNVADADTTKELIKYTVNDEPVAEIDPIQLDKNVRWRDEVDGTDLEDNLEPITSKNTAAYIKNQKRAARRKQAKEKERALKLAAGQTNISDTSDHESGKELEDLRHHSPDRTAVIDSILGRTRPSRSTALTVAATVSPPSSPSPPKIEVRTPKQDWPISNPFVFEPARTTLLKRPSPSPKPKRTVITTSDNLTPTARKQALIAELTRIHPDEKVYLKSVGLLEPAFTPLNTSPIGIHVFVDYSNISIGFDNCLKMARGLHVDTRLQRVPFAFHNFSLILERGRPAAKRVLVGSDRFTAITEAKSLGYETNILERVHKAKELTPRQRKYAGRSGGETSGSETNTGNAPTVYGPEKWVEQAVDEILHLKILESLVDAAKPSTIVLATGDAAEAEYSDGFLRMVERALEKGWCVELISFRLNISSLYKKREFRAKWRDMFKLIELDNFVEYMIDETFGDG